MPTITFSEILWKEARPILCCEHTTQIFGLNFIESVGDSKISRMPQGFKG
jgi:hypothetical protein